MNYYCYFISSCSLNKTYIGITNNLKKRLRQHNGELKGGAKSTRCGIKWEYHTIITGFRTKSEALSFEWYWKHELRFSTIKNSNNWVATKSGINNKMKRLLNLMIYDKKWNHISIFNKSLLM